MKLLELIAKCNIINIKGKEDLIVKGISEDSRKIKEGYLFVAVEGICTDGHSYIEKAIEQGASVIVYDKPMIEEFFSRVTYIQVKDSSIALSNISSAWFNNPSKDIKLIGVTGTNGKTTIATVLYKLFRESGYSVGLLSTICNYVNEKEFPTTHTTLDPINLNYFLRKMVDEGCEYVFMEVSSHAIHQNRISSLQFNGGIFTNLTQDHLDYHKNMKEYRNVKKYFFDNLPSDAFALTNIDDKNGAFMLQNTKANKYTYSIKGLADFKAKILENHFDGTEVEINGKNITIQFVGIFNVYNILSVYGAATVLGLESDEVLKILSYLLPVAGRFQTIKSPKGFTAIIDYAHTPDALTNVIRGIDEVRDKKSKIITVVGCGGNRDKTKRPIMARKAFEMSDKVIYTSDNPRFENPENIMEDMINGLTKEEKQNAICIIDRKEAIKTACSIAQQNDIVLIAGKGHENYQEIKGVKHHFDDKEEVEKIFGII